MRYLNDAHIREMGIDWNELISVVEQVVRTIDEGDYAQPIKPYLRFGDPANRIIAMPAFVGGGVVMSGIKWIASFPGNHRHGLPRAHCVVILNDPVTGKPAACFEGGLISGLRTAAVSGLMMRHGQAARGLAARKVGIVGWGPIGRLHAAMAKNVLGEGLDRITVFDLNGVDPDSIKPDLLPFIEIADGWRAPFRESNVFITSTVAKQRYIDEAPSAGKLLLNISLRDYMPESVRDIGAVVVDDWQEVCRENTDIERLHLEHGLRQSDAMTIADVVCRGKLADYGPGDAVFFNPMGLAAFDIGIAAYFLRKAEISGIGIDLPS
ncbi:2,3-diaminopropionate biosynthesis protein SbnB [Paenibacillus methanolicus]|uniref:Ornithine cyclodeaminase n=1 Tax=Paenibacillus methanolicus TaxID=582686 RepID=A0A5S5CBT5_9BACL|nr:2,3-diaminopropionate biosynthesis protein SbnB [Paenibacillus methanolicus]TYP76619.1 ornithine cyclodeaminase [Paenibacillus methanolicus]